MRKKLKNNHGHSNDGKADPPSGAMQLSKSKIADVAVIIIAWLVALALVYIVILKTCLLFH